MIGLFMIMVLIIVGLVVAGAIIELLWPPFFLVVSLSLLIFSLYMKWRLKH